MNREATAAIGEMVGATAVVISLVYLAIQLRQNTLPNRAAAFQAWAVNCSDSHSFGREIADFRDRALFEPGSLTPAEKMKFDFWFLEVMNTHESMFFIRRLGSVDEEYWQSRSRSLAFAMLIPAFDCAGHSTGRSLIRGMRIWLMG